MPDQIIETLPAVRPASSTEVAAGDFMPLLTVDQAVQRKSQINDFIGKVLREGSDGDGDYGVIPGSKKKVLLKSGAEKLCSIFGMAPTYEAVQVIEDWTGKEHDGEPLFYYEYRCQLSRGGKFMGEAIGSCNTWESKYRWRWVKRDDVPFSLAQTDEEMDALPARRGTVVEFAFAIDKAETGGQYGKPAEYWQRWKEAIASGEARFTTRKSRAGKDLDAYEMGDTLYRIPNPDVADAVNTVQKMAQKRALVAAVLIVTNCSDAFTQDLEDAEPAPVPTPSVAPAPKPPARPVPNALIDTFEAMRENPKVSFEMVSKLESWMLAKAGDRGKQAHADCLAAYRKVTPKGRDTVGSMRELLLDLWEAYDKLVPSSTAEQADQGPFWP